MRRAQERIGFNGNRRAGVDDLVQRRLKIRLLLRNRAKNRAAPAFHKQADIVARSFKTCLMQAIVPT